MLVRVRAAGLNGADMLQRKGLYPAPPGSPPDIPGLELVEPREWEICCGSAGIYNLLKPEPAAELGRRKARHLLEAQVDVVVAANPGCALQIGAHTEALGRRLRVVHPMELLRRSVEA